LWLLRGAMMKEGCKPLGLADNLLAQLKSRAENRAALERRKR
jgi:hypothetical protein